VLLTDHGVDALHPQTEAWESLDAPEGFFDSAPRSQMYEFTAPEGDMLYCRNCQQVDFYGPGDSYPCLAIKGSGRIRIPNGVSVRIFAGKDGVARWM